MRILGGADFIVALRWCDVFAGIAGGFQHTNLYYDDLDHVPAGYSTTWHPGLAILVRAGADFRTGDLVSVGFTAGYGYFRALFGDVRHSIELHARVSFRF